MGDTQVNNIAGRHDYSEWQDALENVAIRPAALDLWAEAALRVTLGRLAKAPLPIVFLGDAVNTACTGEYQQFVEDMHGSPWVAVPGNHDAYFMGNLWFPMNRDNEWKIACRHGHALPDDVAARLKPWLARSNVDASMMSKSIHILLYLHAMFAEGRLRRDPLASVWTSADGWSTFADDAGTLEIGGTKFGFRVYAAISEQQYRGDRESAWRSFVVQDIAVGDNQHVILVDTSDFDTARPDAYPKEVAKNKLFGYCNLPGQCGRIGPDQGRKIAEFVKDIKATGGHYYIAGHHDWQGLSRDSSSLLPYFKDDMFMTYISGHTHDRTATGGAWAKSQWEINVASMTDWPMQFLKIGAWPDGDARDIEVHLQSLDTFIDPNTCRIVHEADPETDRARELNYYGVDGVNRGLYLYAKIIAEAQGLKLPPDLWSRTTEALARTALTYKARDGRTDLIDDTMKRDNLRWLIEFDRQHLRPNLPSILEEEAACAVWASSIE